MHSQKRKRKVLIQRARKSLLYGILLVALIFIILYSENSLKPYHNPNVLEVFDDDPSLSLDVNLKIPDENDIFHEKYQNIEINIYNRKLRRPATKNCTVPPGFPKGPLDSKHLKRLCVDLHLFLLKCDKKYQCKPCIPPWGGSSSLVLNTQRFQKAEQNSRESRRKDLQLLMNTKLKLKHDESSIVLMTLNTGYGYFFLNWYCGIYLRRFAQDIRKTTIIIATDEKMEKLASTLGFVVVRSSWLNNANISIQEDAARGFGIGPHRWVVCLQIIYTFDLISMGYNVIQQDVDVIWLKDIRGYFENTYLDIEMSFDGRLDHKGPGNSGFMHVRSNCKTKIFMSNLVHYIGLVLASGSDQKLWNVFLSLHDFRQLYFQILPRDKFINGHQWGNGIERGEFLSNDIWFMHASWTSKHGDKITKFKMLDYWFLNQSCPFYRKQMVPMHSQPYSYRLPHKRNYSSRAKYDTEWWTQ